MPPNNKNTFRIFIGGGGPPFNIREKGLATILGTLLATTHQPPSTVPYLLYKGSPLSVGGGGVKRQVFNTMPQPGCQCGYHDDKTQPTLQYSNLEVQPTTTIVPMYGIEYCNTQYPEHPKRALFEPYYRPQPKPQYSILESIYALWNPNNKCGLGSGLGFLGFRGLGFRVLVFGRTGR